MKNYIDTIKESILDTWNLDSFIILLTEGDHEYKEEDWQTALIEVVMPKFKNTKYLSYSEKIQLAEEINNIWEIEEFLTNMKFLNFLDNEVSLEDF